MVVYGTVKLNEHPTSSNLCAATVVSVFLCKCILFENLSQTFILPPEQLPMSEHVRNLRGKFPLCIYVALTYL